jgi:hypothetical protein
VPVQAAGGADRGAGRLPRHLHLPYPPQVTLSSTSCGPSTTAQQINGSVYLREQNICKIN